MGAIAFRHSPFGGKDLKFAWTIFTAAVLGLSLIAAPYPKDQLLQHPPTVAALVFLVIGVRKGWLSTASFVCVLAFIWLHILGARYTYSNVPYDEWSTTVVGSSISDWFGGERNHYDRLVHLCFGALCVIPAKECATRWGKMTPRWATLFALFTVMALSAFYETFEWLLTIIMAPEQAETYNGQQGDLWDAQKDTALALAGAVIVIVALAIGGRISRDTTS